MFTGLTQYMAPVVERIAEPPGQRLVVRQAELAAVAQPGESIAVSGCCLTVVEVGDETLAFQAGPETLVRTTLGDLAPAASVNLETAIRAGDPLGGHYVTGHVDGVGTLQSRHDEGDWSLLWFGAPAPLTQQMASKGSIAIDGVSLTLVDVASDRFSVALIPHTLHVTTLGQLAVGDHVNLETDLLAKYVQRQLHLTE